MTEKYSGALPHSSPVSEGQASLRHCVAKTRRKKAPSPSTMDPDLKESVDFDFFDQRPGSQNEDVAPDVQKISASTPPVYPRSTKPLPSEDSVLKDKDSSFVDHRQKSESLSLSDSSRDSSSEHLKLSEMDNKNRRSLDEHKRDKIKSENSLSRLTASLSSISSSYSSSSSSIVLSDSEKSNIYPDIQPGAKVPVSKEKRSKSGSSSESDERPINPLAKLGKGAFPRASKVQKGKVKHNPSLHSDSEDSMTNKSLTLCDDDGDSRKALEDVDKRQAWEERKEMKIKSGKSGGTFNKGKPKTVTIKTADDLDKCSRTSSNTDSDITDVSPIDTPRNISQEKFGDKRRCDSRVTSAGDGHSAKLRFKSVADFEEKNDTSDPDRTKGVDLRILMKAVEELEKQKRLQTNSRRVIFAPATLKSFEKANYTFDKNQTRDIERENNRLLKEIVHQINSGGQRRHVYRQPSSYRLTPSAINREREIQRIESENLAFLKRLQNVKATKSICRDHQLKAYENTTFHGVPIAALHPLPKGKHAQGYVADDSSSIGGRSRSVSSITSVGSSARSTRSAQSSRPRSACTRASSVTKCMDNRPAWSDRW